MGVGVLWYWGAIISLAQNMDDELKRLEQDAVDAEAASVQADKDLIDAREWAVKTARTATDARRRFTKMKMEKGVW